MLMLELSSHNEDVSVRCDSGDGLAKEKKVPLRMLLLSVIPVRQILHSIMY